MGGALGVARLDDQLVGCAAHQVLQLKLSIGGVIVDRVLSPLRPPVHPVELHRVRVLLRDVPVHCGRVFVHQADHDIPGRSGQVLVSFVEAADDVARVGECAGPFDIGGLAAAPVDAVVGDALVLAAVAVVRPVRGALHQLVKLGDAVGLAQHCVKIYGEGADVQAVRRHVLPAAALPHVDLGDGEGGHVDPHKGYRFPEGIVSVAEVLAPVTLERRLDLHLEDERGRILGGRICR